MSVLLRPLVRRRLRDRALRLASVGSAGPDSGGLPDRRTRWALGLVVLGIVAGVVVHPLAAVLAAGAVWPVVRQRHGSPGARGGDPDGPPMNQLRVLVLRVAVCLEAGAAVPSALRWAAATDGVLPDAMRALADELLGAQPGMQPSSPAASQGMTEALVEWGNAAAVIRAGDVHGTRLAIQLRSMVDAWRSQARDSAEAQVLRAGVLAVLPVGCCLLPAFLLIVVVPLGLVMVGGAGELW